MNKNHINNSDIQAAFSRFAEKFFTQHIYVAPKGVRQILMVEKAFENLLNSFLDNSCPFGSDFRRKKFRFRSALHSFMLIDSCSPCNGLLHQLANVSSGNRSFYLVNRLFRLKICCYILYLSFIQINVQSLVQDKFFSKL